MYLAALIDAVLRPDSIVLIDELDAFFSASGSPDLCLDPELADDGYTRA